MSDRRASVVSINASSGGIPKTPMISARIGLGGIDGDLHNHEKHNTPMQAISLIDEEDLKDLRDEGFDVAPGATGENLSVRGLSVDDLAVGSRLRFSGGVEIELTKRRQPCYVLDSIDPRLKTAIRNRCGYLARVVQTGAIHVGETIEVMRPTTVAD